jgi:hypothetical protein
MRLPKVISVIPIILLVLLPCIYCIYFLVEQQITRHRMKEKLESSALQTVIVPVKDFRWYEENREIVVDGMMFDVKSLERQGNNYVVTGLFDEFETDLNITLGKLQHQPDSGNASLVYDILSQLLIDHPGDIGIHRQPDAINANRLILPDEKLYNTLRSLHTPPPRV